MAKPPFAIWKSTPAIRVCTVRAGCAFDTEVKMALSVAMLFVGATPPTQLALVGAALKVLLVVQVVFPALSAQVILAAWAWLAVSRLKVSRWRTGRVFDFMLGKLAQV